MAAAAFTFEGGCDCRAVRYRMESAPLFVHCCHCRWCQRESGASFALNAMIEADRVTLLGAAPELVDTPSESGLGQLIARCPRCRVALWSHYAGAGRTVSFVRVGTLDEPDRLPPDIHIFTASKQPWVVLPPDVPAVPEYYDRKQHWPAASLARRKALLAANADAKPMRAPLNTSDIYPSLTCDDAPAAIEWLCKAFGFTKRFVVPGPDGRVEHSELSHGNGVVMISSPKSSDGRVSPKHLNGVAQALSLYVDDPDSHHAVAIAAGATLVRALQTEDYGARGYMVRDPEGHVWYFGTYRAGANWES